MTNWNWMLEGLIAERPHVDGLKKQEQRFKPGLHLLEQPRRTAVV